MTDTRHDLIGSYWLHAGDTEPFVGREWSFWDFEERVETLAAAGFDGVGIYHADLVYMLEEDGYTLESIRESIEDNGLEYVELEFMTQWMLETDAERRQEEEPVLALLLKAAEALDARHIKVANAWGYDRSLPALRSAFEDLCERARAVDTKVGYELLPPDPVVRSLEDAVAVTESSPNGGLFLDTWHLTKMGITPADVLGLSAGDIVAVEFEDGLYDTEMDFLEETTDYRKLPGQGEFDVDGFITAARDAGFEGPWGMEVLSAEYRELPMAEAYEKAYDAAKRYVD
jgi:sugar phosphate isomerase/epimerase